MKTSTHNPLLQAWDSAYGLPPFAEFKDEHFAPAFKLGIAINLKEVEAIANNPEKPSFDNTIVALERCGELLDRTNRVFGIFINSLPTDALKQLESDLAPVLAAHADAILLNATLFARIKTLQSLSIVRRAAVRKASFGEIRPNAEHLGWAE